MIFIPSELGFTIYSWFLLSLVLLLAFFGSEKLLLLDELLDFEVMSISVPQCWADFSLSMTALREPFLLRAALGALVLLTSTLGGDIRGSVIGLSHDTGVISSCFNFTGFFSFGLLRPEELEKFRPECFFSLSLEEVVELEL